MTLAIGASSLLSAGGKVMEGNAKNKASIAEQAQLEKQAKRVQGVGSREAQEQIRKADIVAGDATAIRAAGGGAMDAGSIERIAKIESEGNYNALSALYDADQEASQLREQGKVVRASGKRAKTSGFISGAGSILEGGIRMFG